MVDGYAAALQLRQDLRFAQTTLVALTAYDSAPDRDRLMAAGFDFHMVKPIHFEDLKRILELTNQSGG